MRRVTFLNLRSQLPVLSALTPSAIAAACVGRTVSAVVAVWACLRGQYPERERARQVQRGFEAAARTLSRELGVRRRGLGTRTANCFRGHARRLWCTHIRSRGWLQHAGVYLSHALPLAVFPHPGRPLCWITIRHNFYSDACTVYRVPAPSSLSES